MTASYNQSYGAGDSVFFPGGISGWHLVRCTPTESLSNQNISRDHDGYYIDTSLKAGGKQASYVEEWECDGDNTTAPSVTIGKIDATTAVEYAELSCANNVRPRLTIAGHVHMQKETADAKHLDGSYECTFAFPSGAWGAVNPFPDSGTAMSTVNDYEITSSTQRFSMNHIDEPGRTGEFLVGASRGVIRTGHAELTTANTVTVGVAANGWIISSKSEPRTNEGVAKMTIDGTRYIDESADASES